MNVGDALFQNNNNNVALVVLLVVVAAAIAVAVVPVAEASVVVLVAVAVAVLSRSNSHISKQCWNTVGGRIACFRSLQCLRHEMCVSGLEGNGSHIGLVQEKHPETRLIYIFNIQQTRENKKLST